MEIFDEKFKDNKLKYVGQSLLATSAVLIVLLVLDTMSNAVIIAALGASSFIAFTMPHAEVSRPRFLIGGYLVGTASGIVCHLLSRTPAVQQLIIVQEASDIVFGAMSVGVAIFVMVIINTEHPPAASVALGLVLNECSILTVTVILIGIVSLSIIKTFLKPILINLL